MSQLYTFFASIIAKLKPYLQNTQAPVIIFFCNKCRTEYKTTAKYEGRSITCKKNYCRNVFLIRSDNAATKNYKYRRFALYILGAVLCLASFYKVYFPVTLIAFGLWGFYMILGKDGSLFLEMLKKLSISTFWGLFAFFILLLLLNLTNHSDADNPPSWLFLVDDFLIVSRENLKKLSEVSWKIYLLITLALLSLSHFFPRSKVLAKYASLQETQGRLTNAIIIVTSFTFFAPDKLDATVDKAYQKWYTAIYREELHQQRVSLITQELNIVLKNTTLKLTSDFIKRFRVEINQAAFQNGNSGSNRTDGALSDDASRAADELMEPLGFKKNTPDTQDFSTFYTEIKQQKKDWYRERQEFVKQEYMNLKVMKENTNNQIEALKNIYLKLFEGILPEELNEWLGIYLGEFLNEIGNYMWEEANVGKIIERLTSFAKSFNLFAWTAKATKKWNITALNMNYTTVKICGNCYKQVPSHCHPGMFCPYHCGAFFTWETTIK